MSVVVPNWRDLYSLYAKTLTENIIPFWEKNSIDLIDGGYFTCLLRDGTVFDTDKFIWLQAREVWMFSKMYNEWEAKASWLNIALHGAEFLEKYGRNENGDWYFSLRKDGKPLVSAYNIFSDCFAVMAFAQLAKATGNDRFSNIAVQTFERILQRQNNPKGRFSKGISGNRELKNFALPMILCNLSLELEQLSDKFDIESLIDVCVKEVMVDFYNEEFDITLENVGPHGSFSDTF